MTLRTYITRRLLVIIPTFFFITLMIFAIIHLAPGDPARVLIGERGLIDPDQFEELRRRLGLDEPIYVQYFIWLGRLLQGNLGYSFVNNRPVNSLIGERIPNTLELVLTAEVVS
ncbi:ABC transporter permease, partial [Candidatus Bathyarchaeota archaeon]|nr:ABC transporter permease [Candidatus Bathyarchaeota archaeon]